jgi:dihydrofolate reductase
MIILGPVAIAENGVIGKNNDLPWHLPEDLKHFKELTLGKNVLMGRKTYESIVARLGKPLPGRTNVVITRQTDFPAPDGVLVFHSVEEATNRLQGQDIYVIGGSEIYKLALPIATKMYVTHVKGQYDGDACFPEVDWSTWTKVEEQIHPQFTFAVYNKKDQA